MSKTPEELKRGLAPYSLSIKGASAHFGLAEKTLRKWMLTGRLHRGIHYLNIGRKPLIIREAFIDFMKKEDGAMWDQDADQPMESPIRGPRFGAPMSPLNRGHGSTKR